MAPFTQHYEEAKVRVYRAEYFIRKVIYSAKVGPQGMVDKVVGEFTLNSPACMCNYDLSYSHFHSFGPFVVLVIY